jgi:hypothetical protein
VCARARTAEAAERGGGWDVVGGEAEVGQAGWAACSLQSPISRLTRPAQPATARHALPFARSPTHTHACPPADGGGQTGHVKLLLLFYLLIDYIYRHFTI